MRTDHPAFPTTEKRSCRPAGSAQCIDAALAAARNHDDALLALLALLVGPPPSLRTQTPVPRGPGTGLLSLLLSWENSCLHNTMSECVFFSYIRLFQDSAPTKHHTRIRKTAFPHTRRTIHALITQRSSTPPTNHSPTTSSPSRPSRPSRPRRPSRPSRPSESITGPSKLSIRAGALSDHLDSGLGPHTRHRT